MITVIRATASEMLNIVHGLRLAYDRCLDQVFNINPKDPRAKNLHQYYKQLSEDIKAQLDDYNNKMKL